MTSPTYRLHEQVWKMVPGLPRVWCPILQEEYAENDKHVGEYQEPILVERDHEKSICPEHCEEGKVRGPLAESLELAFTRPDKRADLSQGYREYEERVVRDVPGEVECKICSGLGFSSGIGPHFPCDACLGSGAVLGTDEASVVARRRGCGLLLHVYGELLLVGRGQQVYDTGLLGLVLGMDYGGACKAIAEVVPQVKG